MSGRKKTGSGGAIERTIFFIAGCIMGGIGALAAWYSYKWATSDVFFEHRWAWITIAGGLAFFMLRGAWFTVLPQKEDDFVEFNTGGR